jgi:hypothetical protein
MPRIISIQLLVNDFGNLGSSIQQASIYPAVQNMLLTAKALNPVLATGPVSLVAGFRVVSKKCCPQRGTEGSNPPPSSGESGANLSLAGIRLSRSRSHGFPRRIGKAPLCSDLVALENPGIALDRLHERAGFALFGSAALAEAAAAQPHPELIDRLGRS